MGLGESGGGRKENDKRYCLKTGAIWTSGKDSRREINQEILKGLIVSKIKKEIDIDPDYVDNMLKDDLRKLGSEISVKFSGLSEIVKPGNASTKGFFNLVEQIFQKFKSKRAAKSNLRSSGIYLDYPRPISPTKPNPNAAQRVLNASFELLDQCEVQRILSITLDGHDSEEKQISQAIQNRGELLLDYLSYKQKSRDNKSKMEKLTSEKFQIEKRLLIFNRVSKKGDPALKLKLYEAYSSNPSQKHIATPENDDTWIQTPVDSFLSSYTQNLFHEQKVKTGELYHESKELEKNKNSYNEIRMKVKNLNSYLIKNPAYGAGKGIFLVEAVMNLIKLNEEPNIRDFWEGFGIDEIEFL